MRGDRRIGIVPTCGLDGGATWSGYGLAVRRSDAANRVTLPGICAVARSLDAGARFARCFGKLF